MKLPNLKNLMISVSEFKNQASEIINKKMTKVIIRNNNPVSVIMPYEDYAKLKEDVLDSKNFLKGIGQDITLSNGVQAMVCVDTKGNELDTDGIAIKVFIKMKSGDYKLHYTLHLGNPSTEQTLTHEELMEHYGFTNKK